MKLKYIFDWLRLWYYVALAVVELLAVFVMAAVLLIRIGTGNSPDLLTDIVLVMLVLGAHGKPAREQLREQEEAKAKS